MIIRIVPAILAGLIACAATSFGAEVPKSCPAQGKLPPPVLTSHTLAPYPTESQNAGEHGQTQLTVTIDAEGAPEQISVIGSSGYPRLDDATVSIIRSHWRWQAFPADCNTPSVQIAIVFGWFLSNPPKTDFELNVSASQYPAGAAERYERGNTYLAIALDNAGTVTDGNVEYSSGYADLDEKALALLKNAPGVFAGKPAGKYVMAAKWNLPSPQKDNVEVVVIKSPDTKSYSGSRL